MAEQTRHARDASGALYLIETHCAVPVTAWHSHASLVVGRVVSGRRSLRLIVGGLDLGPGDGFVVPPDHAHAWSAGTAHIRIITLDPTRVAIPRCSAGILKDGAWNAAFDTACDAIDEGTAFDIAPLLDLTARLCPPPPEIRILAGAVRKARRIAATRLEEPLHLGDLGRQVGLSPWHLHRLYHAAWGLTPAAHRLEERLRLARRLLLDGSSVAEAAATAGFSDQSHLCRAFRRLMGVPPATWLRQVRRSHAPG